MDKYKKNKQNAGSQPHGKTSICIPNMSILACMVAEKSLTKNFIIQSMERKKIGQIHRRIRRRYLVLNSTIQQVVINLHTKYEHSSLHGCEKPLTKNFILQSMDGKKEGHDGPKLLT